MKTKLLFTVFCIYLIAGQIFAQENYQSNRLTKLWETKEGLKVPESVLYAAKDNVLYVSCINGKAWEKEGGKGFISKLSTKGEFISLEWVTGLNAPKGMGIYNGKLYVTCIDELVEIDIATAKVINHYKNDKAINLNDISVGKDGTVYVSDSAGKCIFCLKNGKLEVFVESDQIAKTNGLLVNDGKLLAGSGNKAMSIDLTSKAISSLVDETGYIDGLVAVGDGSFLISDWQGHVQQIRAGKGGIKLLDTTPEKINAADIEFIKGEKILLVPTFLNNKVVAYKLKM
jgi:sugar lactone lactonase YvrE